MTATSDPQEETSKKLIVVQPTFNPDERVLSKLIQNSMTHQRKGEERFPQGENLTLFTKQCIGRPFLILAPFVFEDEPAKTFVGRSGRKVHISAQVVAYSVIQFVTVNSAGVKRVGSPQQVKWSGTYLTNQLQRLPENHEFSKIWTLARNENMPMTPQGEFPVMLATYYHGVDTPEEIEESAIYEPQHGATNGARNGTRNGATNGLSNGERKAITRNATATAQAQDDFLDEEEDEDEDEDDELDDDTVSEIRSRFGKDMPLPRHAPTQEQLLKRGRGRPAGSKNRPK